MPSPFPGMNPYLERPEVWHDFHERLVPAVAEQIGPQILPRYVTKIDEHVYIHDLPGDVRQFLGRADVGVTPLNGASPGSGGGVAVLEAPIQVRLPQFDQTSEAFIEIRDRQGRELITVIELLSPSNKRPGKDREQYEYKRWQLTCSGVNLVEIDLLRSGERMPMTGLQPCDYCVMVCTQPAWPRGGAWPISLRDPLPVIPVPLRPGEPHARLDLKQALDRVYDAAGYVHYVYAAPPEPPLSPNDATWAKQFIPNAS